MKHLATVTLMLAFGVAAVYADEKPVKMTFSGTAGNSAISLQQPNTSNDEDNFAGKGTLGSFTVRNERALPNSPTPSDSCSGPDLVHFTETTGGSVFRFNDGSLLYLNVTHGDDCINFVTNEFRCALSLKITGGTGRFKDASGVLTMTETGVSVISDNPVYFAATGEFTGIISGICDEQDRDERR